MHVYAYHYPLVPVINCPVCPSALKYHSEKKDDSRDKFLSMRNVFHFKYEEHLSLHVHEGTTEEEKKLAFDTLKKFQSAQPAQKPKQDVKLNTFYIPPLIPNKVLHAKVVDDLSLIHI